MDWIDERVRRVIERQERELPGDAGFLQKLDEARERLSAVPESQELCFDATRKPIMGTPSPAEARELLPCLHGWLGFLCRGMSYQTRQLVGDIARGLGDANYLGVFGAARMLMERSATVHGIHRKIEPRIVALLSRGDGEERREAIARSHETLYRYAIATTVAWEAASRGDLETFYAGKFKGEGLGKLTHVHDLLRELPEQGKGEVMWYYEGLCDFVHPNARSHELTIDAMHDEPDGRRRIRLAFHPGSDAAIAKAAHGVAIPVRQSLVFLLEQLGELTDFFEKLG
ncbi:MAG: hypothetical protein ACYCWW_20585, partial [Deltaproteobacteria bacterium]